MAFLDICKTRESVRGYKGTPVENEKLDYNLEPAVLIPIGYSASESNRDKSRKDIEDIVETI